MNEPLHVRDIDFDPLVPTTYRMDLVTDGVHHGRATCYDTNNQLYYKFFHSQYCRKSYFQSAYQAGFFTPDIAPAFRGLICNDDGMIGYVTQAGTVMDTDEWRYKQDGTPTEFWQNLIHRMNETRLIFYDIVPVNIVQLSSGEFSLIDLESVYPFEQLEKCLEKFSSILKPADLLSYLDLERG